MMVFFRKKIFYLFKLVGNFYFAKNIAKRKLHILCYHGFSCNDQSTFRSKLFINEHTFSKRIDYLVKNNFRFINLSELDQFLNGDFSCDRAVLLTIDDGWKSTHDIALPILKKHDIPHIIYLYTDCFVRGVPVVNVLLQYALWKTEHYTIDWNDLSYDLTLDQSRNELLQQLLQETKGLKASELSRSLEKIFSSLGVEYSKERDWENFRLLNEAELKDHLSSKGSFQLHTHHHINPLQDELLKEELLENQRIIKGVTGQKAEHFCYPSGEYSPAQFPLLRELGIKSAVTCDPGLNEPTTEPYELKRFLDGENISQIEFEAEMSGFMDVLRGLFRRKPDRI